MALFAQQTTSTPALRQATAAASHTDAEAVSAVSPARIQLEAVNVQFTTRNGTTAALQNIDLTIREGEFVCLVGPSGCGKSTLLSVIAGLQKANSGSALMDGKPITGPGPERAVIFQEAALFPWLTAAQNVEFALKQRIRNKKERREAAIEHLSTVHLARFADSYPHELSGGMRQRVAIARALSLNPEILLMDEPFAALDAQTRDLLLAEVQRIWQSTGKTILFVTHNVMEAVTLGDRVICMGTRPGTIKQEIAVSLPRPRAVEHPDTARLAQRIMTHLRDEIDKIAQEESDHAATLIAPARSGDTGDIPDPLANSMGDGI